MSKKYEFTGVVNSDGLKQIRCIRELQDVSVGTVGGFIEKEENLSHEGNSWVYDDSQVFGDCKVLDDARVQFRAQIRRSVVLKNNSAVYGDRTVLLGDITLDNGVVGPVYTIDEAEKLRKTYKKGRYI